ncbi:diguanylate cyclase [Dasania marina]|uniref:diguanylate cyclase domain-containing protein n=1 Tax=Dasania marina TaxID=471499 RepID=UPI0030D8E065|tara:strand:+ start:93118 stop:94380 length:1263 start_codon:yes stop_codon:yes gene_type:complete
MKKILIVEDSTTVTKILRHLVNQQPDIEAFFAGSLAESEEVYQAHKDEIFAAVVDLNLPDAPDGESVDHFLAKKIPVIVLSANYKEETRSALLDKGIVDYVIKESRYSYNYVFKLVRRLDKNQHIKVLVVEDSRPTRAFIRLLLQRHLYQVLEATNGLEALDVLKDNTDIKMLITDYHMPEMDGFALVKALRQNVDKSDLIIIGLSGEGESSLSAKFIKNGANDFLQKPFFHEEFHCRIMHNIENLELLESIQDAANRDYLTNLHNRRYFYSKGEAQYQLAVKNGSPIAVAIFDIDKFKKINDNYGHKIGDQVLRFLADEIRHNLLHFLVARMGGEQFCAIFPNLKNEQAMTLMDRLRSIVSDTSIPIDHEDQDIDITISVGVTNYVHDSLEQQINYASELLSHAKEAGRNIVVGDDDEL